MTWDYRLPKPQVQLEIFFSDFQLGILEIWKKKAVTIFCPTPGKQPAKRLRANIVHLSHFSLKDSLLGGLSIGSGGLYLK